MNAGGSFITMTLTGSLMSSAPVLADVDDWIGLDDEPPATRVGLLLTRDEQANSTQALYLQQLLSDAVTLDINISRDRLNQPQQVFNSDDFKATLAFELNPDWSSAIGYQFQGQRAELEIEQFSLRIEYAPYPAFGSLEITEGDVTLFSRDDLPARFNPAAGISSDMSSRQLEVGWWFDNFTLSARYLDIDYQRDITRLESRPLLQTLVKPGALAQSGLLMARQASIDFSLPLEPHRLAAHVSSTTSALNHLTIRSLQLDWNHHLGKQWDGMIFISRYQGDDPDWTLSVGLEWNG